MSSQRLTETPSETATTPTDYESVDRDDAYHLLSNARRRAVMRYLLDVEETTELGTLAEHVAAIENDCDPDALSSDDRKRVYISLYQGHMPKLDQHGLVDYDQARGVVSPKPLVEAFAPFLDERPLSREEPAIQEPNRSSGFISSLFGR
ncbi:DUF7344 domain-containing protein [Halomarina oriensis]|uniref:DUF7344 domain-containing protein n=1 Tax=Halomarina oriensis TaxID=671145 RepID=A0A6B0GPK0_9EURY|nr:hypothetical protein [Halomarina oriensis]MWG33548.1 hypothetical protein [Halomarina oriensis]